MDRKNSDNSRFSLRNLIAKSPAVSGIAIAGSLSVLRISSFFESLFPGGRGDEILKFLDHFGLPVLIGLGTYALGKSYKRERENQRLQNELRESKEELEDIVNTMADGLMRLDENGRLTRANSAVCQILQYTEDELKGKSYEFWTAPECLGEMEAHLKERQKGKTTSYETQFKRKDGAYVKVFVIGASIIDGKKYLGAVGCIKDITLLSGVAHDIKNQLTAATGFNKILESYIQKENPGSLHLELVRDIRIALKKTQRIIQEMIGFSNVRGYINPNEALSDATRYVSYTGDKYFVEEELRASWGIHGNDLQINRALENIVKNAVEAMPDGGILRVSSRDLILAEGQAIAGVNLSGEQPKSGKYVALSVSDNGSGISKEILPKLTNPDFTTKIGGTGKGLWNVATIVRNHNGYLAVETEKGKGSIFSLYLPTEQKAD